MNIIKDKTKQLAALVLIFSITLLLLVITVSESKKTITSNDQTFEVTITAYTPRVEETDSTPMITACNTKSREGIVAVSRDLFKSGTACGKVVILHGYGKFVIEDTMNKRYSNRVDILVDKVSEARAIGINNGKLTISEEINVNSNKVKK